jgi:hypothetical protein
MRFGRGGGGGYSLTVLEEVTPYDLSCKGLEISIGEMCVQGDGLCCLAGQPA